MRPGRDADHSPLLVPWSRKSRAITLFPLWVVRPVQNLSAFTWVQFTYFTYLTQRMRFSNLGRVGVDKSPSRGRLPVDRPRARRHFIDPQAENASCGGDR